MRLSSVFLSLAIVILFTGCLKSLKDPMLLKDDLMVQKNPFNTYTLDETIKKIGSDLVYGLDKNREKVDDFALTAYVELGNFSKTSQFGRLLSESLIHEFESKMVDIIDYRGQKGVSINAHGEFFLSRNVKRLKNSIDTDYILVGTYSKVPSGYLINSRIVNNKDGKVISTSRLIFNTMECELFENCKPANNKIKLTASKWKM